LDRTIGSHQPAGEREQAKDIKHKSIENPLFNGNLDHLKYPSLEYLLKHQN
jgi:hypothetical protein